MIGRISKAIYDAWASSPMPSRNEQTDVVFDGTKILEQERLNALHLKTVLQEEQEFHDH